MKFIRTFILMALIFSPHAFAALSTYGQATGTATAQLGTTSNLGDLIVVSAENSTGSFTFTDTYNTYATPVVVGPDEYGNYYGLSWAINVTTAQMTVIATGALRCGIFAITGFVHGPVVISGDTSSVVVTGTSLVTSGFTATKNNEISVGLYGTNGDTPTINSADYTTIFEAGTYRLATIAAISTDGYNSGTNLAFNATVAGSGAVALIQGFYDGSGAASCTHDGYVNGTGAVSVPTASSTSVWLQSGAFGTTDCSATKYWQIPGGVFGAN